MKVLLDFVLREVAGETLLIPAGRTALNLNGMLTLNELGAEIWRMLPEAKNEEEIISKILEEYDAQPEEVRRDVAEFFGKLRELGIIENS